jgi:hypothetical protein
VSEAFPLRVRLSILCLYKKGPGRGSGTYLATNTECSKEATSLHGKVMLRVQTTIGLKVADRNYMAQERP